MRFLALRKFALRSLCHPWMGQALAWIYRRRIPFKEFVVDTQGLAPGIVARIYWGKYERAEIDFVREFLPPHLDIVELGGSLGIVSLQLLAKRSDGRQLVTVEANPNLIPFWKRNVAQLNPADCKCINAAIDYAGHPRVTLTTGPDSLSATVDQSAGTITVAATTLSEILAANSIGDFVLVADIEGAEQGILWEDASALVRCRQMIIELHQTVDHTILDLVRRIEELGFEQVQSRGPVFVFRRKSTVE